MINSYNKGILRGILIYTIILLLCILSINNLFIKREGHSYSIENDNHYDEHKRWHKGECKYDSKQYVNEVVFDKQIGVTSDKGTLHLRGYSSTVEHPRVRDHVHVKDDDLTYQRSPIGVLTKS